MRNLMIFICSAIIMAVSTVSFAGVVPEPLRDIRISTEIGLDNTSGIYTYAYRIYNPSTNKGRIVFFQIDITKNPGAKELNSEHLTIMRGFNINGNIMIKSFDEEAAKIKRLDGKATIPVGAQPPLGHPFPGWTADIALRGVIMWGGSDQTGILPDQSQDGFLLTSYGLPGIRDAVVEPDIDYDNLPDEYTENVELTQQLEDNINFRGKTVGPVAPPAEFSAIAFIDRIIFLKHEAFKLGWIDNEGVVISLDKKLDAAKRAIQNNSFTSAKNVLDAFIKEVDAQGCAAPDKCTPGKHLTPEAWALLKYNAQYLLGRL